MSKKQTRISYSFSRIMALAIRQAADRAGVSVSQWLHDAAAVKLRTEGVDPPVHRPGGWSAGSVKPTAEPLAESHDELRRRIDDRADQRRDNGRVDTSRIPLPADAPIARMRAAGKVSVFKPRLVTAENRESDDVIEAKLAGRPLPEAAPTCRWCGEVFAPGTKNDRRQRVETATDGPHHRKCLDERMRVERRTAVL